jgi:hypothetical protein
MNELNIIKIYDVPLDRLRELFKLFQEQNLNLANDNDWKEIKRTFFNKVEEIKK